jgi:hypothetical protein
MSQVNNMPHMFWHDYLMLLSFVAAIAGLFLLADKNASKDEREIVDRILFRMVFAYWLVHCVVFVLKPCISEDWEFVCLSVRFTSVMSYLLTLTCILSMSLHRFSSRRQTQ